jgi:hypothetical protein
MSDNTENAAQASLDAVLQVKSLKSVSGGKRRKAVSKKGSSKKGSSKKSSRKLLELEGGKKKSKKGSSKKSSRKLLELEGGKKKSKKGSSKKSSRKLLELEGGKKKSKKGSRKMKREMPKFMKDVLEIKSKIKADDSSVKDGIPLTTLVSRMYKENDLQVSKTVSAYMSDKSGFAKKLAAVVKEMEAKRAAKKAGKA